MNGKQLKDLTLAVRAETAAVLVSAVDGHRQELPIDPSQLSRYCTDECANPLAYVALMVRLLPEDRAATLLATIEDAYTDAHGGETDLTLASVWAEMDHADSAQDMARMAVLIGEATDEKLQDYIHKSRQQDRTNERARRWATQELRRRNGYQPPMRPLRPDTRTREMTA